MSSSSKIPLSPVVMRQKTLSESSDGGDPSSLEVARAGAPDNGEAKYLYDIDGKFPYSVYNKNPELYDIDGKHPYKFFSQLKHLASPNAPAKSNAGGGGDLSQANHDSNNVLYDLDGKFSYTVYNPALHQSLFTGKSK